METDFTTFFDSDLLSYLARRYDTSVENVVNQFLKQSGIEKEDSAEYGFSLESNEVEILKDYYLRCVPVL